MQSIELDICTDASDAIRKGYLYRPPIYLGLYIIKAVVVENGTEENNATVDIILQAPNGQKYVAMITANLLKSIPI